MRWVKGRQNTGYEIFTLIRGDHIPFDCYIIKYPPGSYIPPHMDKVKAPRKHFRVNIVLKASKTGGEFVCKDTIINTKRFKFFRPDISEHSVTEVGGNTRYVLSFGWTI